MTNKKILALGATGPSGIVLLRELLHRGHSTIAYVRNPAKIPAELLQNPLLEVVHGQMDDEEKLDSVVCRTSIVLSILAPVATSTPDPAQFQSYFTNLIASMKRHGVKRLVTLNTLSSPDPDDKFSWTASISVFFVRNLINAAYRTVRGIVDVVKKEGQDLDWTIYRVPILSGDASAESWNKDRQSGETYAGPIGGKGWKIFLPRALLASWLVDCAEGKHTEWIKKMPAISLRG
ncbi:hypothetical protein B0I35DRAFT_516442 [Stachybotrys elegans]|uniref:NAD(P)-binding domain-containing protein n=1 Tax=Stachybotrys elegans TaxID=80388 RepID=A0A8K0WKB9_9HYPO|nr:hypothetical protein B0I35DRAFT_516442 [Stachybotrys elegans]